MTYESMYRTKGHEQVSRFKILELWLFGPIKKEWFAFFDFDFEDTYKCDWLNIREISEFWIGAYVPWLVRPI